MTRPPAGVEHRVIAHRVDGMRLRRRAQRAGARPRTGRRSTPGIPSLRGTRCLGKCELFEIINTNGAFTAMIASLVGADVVSSPDARRMEGASDEGFPEIARRSGDARVQLRPVRFERRAAGASACDVSRLLQESSLGDRRARCRREAGRSGDALRRASAGASSRKRAPRSGGALSRAAARRVRRTTPHGPAGFTEVVVPVIRNTK